MVVHLRGGGRKIILKPSLATKLVQGQPGLCKFTFQNNNDQRE